MTPEQDFVNNEVMPRLRERGHAVHVQNTAESGTPDINYAIFPVSGWIETKVAKSGWLYFETFQIPWFRKRCRALKGTGVFVLAKVDGRPCLWPAMAIVKAERHPYRKWVRVRVEALVDPIATDWPGILQCLTALSGFTSSSDTL